MHKTTWWAVLGLAGALAGGAVAAAEVTGLRCEYRTDPLGIDAVRPRLGWVMVEGQSSNGTKAQSARGIRQTAYRVIVASSPEKLA